MPTNGTPLIAQDSDQVVPSTSRKVFVAVDENGLRIGETHHNARMTDAQIDDMRDKREKEGWSHDRLAEHFGVSYIAAVKICAYERRASTIARWKVLLLHTPISLTTHPKED